MIISKVITRVFRAIPYFLIGVIFGWFVSGFWIHRTPFPLLIEVIKNRVIFLGGLGVIMILTGIRFSDYLPSEHSPSNYHPALQWIISVIGVGIFVIFFCTHRHVSCCFPEYYSCNGS